MFDSTETTWSTSSRVVSRDRGKRTAPCRLFSGKPMACRTCDGSIEQDPQADPSEAAMPTRLRWWRIARFRDGQKRCLSYLVAGC